MNGGLVGRFDWETATARALFGVERGRGRPAGAGIDTAEPGLVWCDCSYRRYVGVTDRCLGVTVFLIGLCSLRAALLLAVAL